MVGNSSMYWNLLFCFIDSWLILIELVLRRLILSIVRMSFLNISEGLGLACFIDMMFTLLQDVVVGRSLMYWRVWCAFGRFVCKGSVTADPYPHYCFTEGSSVTHMQHTFGRCLATDRTPFHKQHQRFIISFISVRVGASVVTAWALQFLALKCFT